MVLVRTVLWFFVFTGFALNTMMKNCINFTLIAMIKHKTPPNVTIPTDRENQIHNTTIAPDVQNTTAAPFILDEKGIMFEWSRSEEALILGSIFWFQWLSQIPGGLLAQKYGTKLVVGMSVLSQIFCTLATPAAAQWNIYLLVTLRIFHGFASGVFWPSMHHLIAQWVPANERSKFVSAETGNTLGVAAVYPLCGLILTYFSWQYVFYLCGSVALIWNIFWFRFVYNSPSQHPTISQDEKNYILANTNFSTAKKRPPVPWRAILTSRPLFVNIMANWGGMWGIYTLQTQAPTYLKRVHQFSVQMNGIICGTGHFAKVIFAYIFAINADKLLKKEKLSRTTVRKLAVTVCITLQGIFLIGLAFSSHCKWSAALFLTVATMVHGAVSSGPLSSLIDLSPNFASILQGISGTINSCPGFLSPFLVGYLTRKHPGEEGWQIFFTISGAMLIAPGLIYLFFADSSLQPWNDNRVVVKNPFEQELTEKLSTGTNQIKS